MHQNGIELHAKQLQLLALNMSEAVKEVSGSPFDKVLNMIRDMISKIKKDMREQTKKNGECTRLYAENKRGKDAAEEALADAILNIDEAVATLAELRADQKERDEEEKSALAALAAAAKQRAEEKKEAEETTTKLGAEVSMVNDAISALEKYYDNDDGTTTSQQNSGGKTIIDMLYGVVHDTEETINATQNDEGTAQKKYDALVQREKLASAERKTSSTFNRESVASAEKTNAENAEIKRENEENLDRLKDTKISIDVDKKCVANAGKSLKDLHEEAMAAFKDQSTTLQKALEMLNNYSPPQ